MNDPDDSTDIEAELSESVRELHSTMELSVKIRPNRQRGGFDWESKLTGEDFLDGHWEAQRDGHAKTSRKALIAGAKATKRDRWYRRFPHRDNQGD